MLEEQLATSRKRCEAVLGLENDIIKVKMTLTCSFQINVHCAESENML